MRCVVIWSIREDQYVDLPSLTSTFLLSIPYKYLLTSTAASRSSGLETRIHLTGNGRKRLSVDDALDDIMKEDGEKSLPSTAASTWVYISGPNAFIEAGEVACKKRQKRGVEWYGARWDI